MRRDQIIGATVSLLFYASLAWFGSRPVKVVRSLISQPNEPVVVFPVPPPPPEPVEDVDPGDHSPPRVDAPPSQPEPFTPPGPSDIIERMPPAPRMQVVSSTIAILPRGNPGAYPADVPPIYDPSMLDQRPEPTVQTKPTYPFEKRRAGIGGEVIVDFIVDARGDVLHATAIRGPATDFEDAAVHAVEHWKFRPGRKGGAFVSTHMQVPIEFQVDLAGQ